MYYFIRVFKINEKDETVILPEVTYIFPVKEVHVTADMFTKNNNNELWKEYKIPLMDNI